MAKAALRLSGMRHRSQRCHNLEGQSVETRMRSGVIALGASLLLLVGLAKLEAHVVWGLLAVPPLYGAFLLTYQASLRICPSKAKRGLRDFGAGEERIVCSIETALLRRRGKAIGFLSFASASFVGIGFLILAKL